MMQMKTQKKGFAKIIRHGRLMAKIDNMLIISTLAIFRFFANVFGFKTIAVKFIKLLTSDKKKPPSMCFYIRLAHFTLLFGIFYRHHLHHEVVAVEIMDFSTFFRIFAHRLPNGHERDSN